MWYSRANEENLMRATFSPVAVVLLFTLGGTCWAEGDLIFADGFERGDTSAWSSEVGKKKKATVKRAPRKKKGRDLAKGGMPGEKPNKD